MSSSIEWWSTLQSMPPPFRDAAKSVHSLCSRIQFLSFYPSILHPTKCRCLAESYSQLIKEVLFLFRPLSASPSRFSSSSPNSPLFLKLSMLFPVLLSTLEKGEQFLQDCTYETEESKWWIPGSARKHRKKWLINSALDISLSTAIFDVHLHNFLWCISMLIWVLSDYGDDGLCGWMQAKRVEVLLRTIWASANEEHDVESMRRLLLRIGAELGDEQICNLICDRLSASASKAARASLSTDTLVPAYMWMDPLGLKISSDRFLGSNDSVVVSEAKLMGRKLVCKRFLGSVGEKEFKREALVHAQLCHANVTHLVCCTDRPPVGEGNCLLMEFMHQDLCSLIKMQAKKAAPFTLLVKLDVMLQVAKGMEYLHGLGVMHRDLKSRNILVSDERGHMIVKLADFGLSKFRHDSSLYTTKGIGTSIWIAPEVEDDEDEAKYTKKADVYSFAIVCAEILTGLPPDELLPFVTRKKLCKLLKEGKRPDLPSSCPLAISSYIKKCWHGDASQRPGFTQICRALRFFKACVLLGETEMLASPLQDGMLDVGVLAVQGTAGQGQSVGALDHHVLDIPYEVRIFQSIKEQNSPRGSEGDLLTILQSRKLDSCSELKIDAGGGLSGNAFKYDPRDGSVVAVRWHSLYNHHANCFVGVVSKIMQQQILDSPTEVIGEGSLGSVFKCDLKDGFNVVVRWLKNITAEREQGEHQIATMLKLEHYNLVRLLAHRSYYAKKEHVLVSEYITNAVSLSELLLHGVDEIDEEAMLLVAKKAALGIKHLHDHECVHGNIKSSNVLRVKDKGWNRCDRWVLANYGIALLVRDTDANVGYRAPELRMSKEADVYSYGMLLLELVTGLNPAQGTEEMLRLNSLSEQEKIQFVERRASIVKRGEPYAQSLGPLQTPSMRLLQIASRCLLPNPSERPALKDVIATVRHTSIIAFRRDSERRSYVHYSLSPKSDTAYNYEDQDIWNQL